MAKLFQAAFVALALCAATANAGMLSPPRAFVSDRWLPFGPQPSNILVATRYMDDNTNGTDTFFYNTMTQTIAASSGATAPTMTVWQAQLPAACSQFNAQGTVRVWGTNLAVIRSGCDIVVLNSLTGARTFDFPTPGGNWVAQAGAVFPSSTSLIVPYANGTNSQLYEYDLTAGKNTTFGSLIPVNAGQLLIADRMPGAVKVWFIADLSYFFSFPTGALYWNTTFPFQGCGAPPKMVHIMSTGVCQHLVLACGLTAIDVNAKQFVSNTNNSVLSSTTINLYMNGTVQSLILTSSSMIYSFALTAGSINGAVDAPVAQWNAGTSGVAFAGIFGSKLFLQTGSVNGAGTMLVADLTAASGVVPTQIANISGVTGSVTMAFMWNTGSNAYVFTSTGAVVAINIATYQPSYLFNARNSIAMYRVSPVGLVIYMSAGTAMVLDEANAARAVPVAATQNISTGSSLFPGVLNNNKWYWQNVSSQPNNYSVYDVTTGAITSFYINGSEALMGGGAQTFTPLWFTPAWLVVGMTSNLGKYVCRLSLADASAGTNTSLQCAQWDNFTNCAGGSSWTRIAYAGDDVYFAGPQGGSTRCVYRFLVSGNLTAIGSTPKWMSTTMSGFFIDSTTNLLYIGTPSNIVVFGPKNWNGTDAAGAIWNMALPDKTTGFTIGSSVNPIMFGGFLYVAAKNAFNTWYWNCLEPESLTPQWAWAPGTGGVMALSAVTSWMTFNGDVMYVQTASAGMMAIGRQAAGAAKPTIFWTSMNTNALLGTTPDGTLFTMDGTSSGNTTSYRYLSAWVNNFYFACPMAPFPAGAAGFVAMYCANDKVVTAEIATGRFAGSLYSTSSTPIAISGSNLIYATSTTSKVGLYDTVVYSQPLPATAAAPTTLAAAAATLNAVAVPSPVVGLAFAQWNLGRPSNMAMNGASFANFVNSSNALVSCLAYNMSGSSWNYMGVVAVDSTTGAAIWGYWANMVSCTVTANGPIITLVTETSFIALDAQTGRVAWNVNAAAQNMAVYLFTPTPTCGFAVTTPPAGSTTSFTINYVSMSTGNQDGLYPWRSAPYEQVQLAAGWTGQCAVSFVSQNRLVTLDGYGNTWIDSVFNVANHNMTQVTMVPPVVCPTTKHVLVALSNQTNSWISAIRNGTGTVDKIFSTVPTFVQPQPITWMGFDAQGNNLVVVINSWIMVFDYNTTALRYTVTFNYDNFMAAFPVFFADAVLFSDIQGNLHRFNLTTGAFMQSSKVLGYAVNEIVAESSNNYVNYVRDSITLPSVKPGSLGSVYQVNAQTGISFVSALTVPSTSGMQTLALGTGNAAVTAGGWLQAAQFTTGAIVATTTSNIYLNSFDVEQGMYYTVTVDGYAQQWNSKTPGAAAIWNTSLGLTGTPNDVYGYVSADNSVYVALSNNSVCALSTTKGASALGTNACFDLTTAFAPTCTFIPGISTPFIVGQAPGVNRIFVGVSNGTCLFQVAMGPTGTTYQVTAVSAPYSDMLPFAYIDGSGIVFSDSMKLYRIPFASFSPANTWINNQNIQSIALPRATNPVLINGQLVVGTINGISALDPNSLAVQWSFPSAGRITNQPQQLGSNVIAVDQVPSIIYALSSGGAVAWSASFTDTVYENATLVSAFASQARQVLVVALSKGQVVFDVNGNIVWSDFGTSTWRSFATVACFPDGRIFATPQSCGAISLTQDSANIIATCNSQFIARDVGTGQILLNLPSAVPPSRVLENGVLAYPGTTSIFQQSLTIPPVAPAPPTPPTTGIPSLRFYATLSGSVFDQASFQTAIAAIAGCKSADVNVIAWNRNTYGYVQVDFTVPASNNGLALMKASAQTLGTAGITQLGNAPENFSSAPGGDSDSAKSLKGIEIGIWAIVVLIVVGGFGVLIFKMRAGSHGHAHGGGHDAHHGDVGSNYSSTKPTAATENMNVPLMSLRERDGQVQ